MRRRLAQEGDEGFTLIELLVVIVILPLVVGAIATGMISSFTNSGTTKTRLADSHDAQITSTYFVRDVQSAQFVSTSTTALCGGAQQLIGVSWSARTSTGAVVTYAATYSVDPSADTLVRSFCSGGSTSTIVLAHNAFVAAPAPVIGACPGVGLIGVAATSCALTGSVAHAAVTVSCTDGTTFCANAGPLATTAPSAGAVGVNLVTLDVLEAQSGFVYHLTAAPRGWTTVAAGAPGGGVAGSPALQLVGSNPTIGLQGSSACSLNVNGVAAINTTTAGAISENKDGQFGASGGVYAQTPNPVSGGTSPPVTQGPPLADPYANLTPPSAATTGVPVTVINGNFKPSGQLDGIYIISGGITSSNNDVSTGPDGVLLYVTGGPVDLTGNATLNLTKPVSAYAPIVLWIAAGDPNPTISLGGNGNVTTIGGTVYAPTGALTLHGGGNSGGVSAGAVVTNSISCQGGGNSVGFSFGPLVTTTSLTSAPNPAADGNPVTLTAQVNSSQTVNGGQLLFTVVGKGGPTGDCTVPAIVGSTGAATCVTGNLSAANGPYTITAYYQGNSSFGASNSSPLTQNVLLPTTTVLTESPPSPVAPGQVVTYSVAVTAVNGTTPSGTVTFAGVTCTGGSNAKTLDGTGHATCQSALHGSGSPYAVTAGFAQNSSYLGSSAGPVNETVNPFVTTTTVTSSKNPSIDQDVIFTATVSPAPTDGTITWTITGAASGCWKTTDLIGSTATCTVKSNGFQPGSASVTAQYFPGSSKDFAGSTGFMVQTVNGSGNTSSTTSAALTKSGNAWSESATVTGSGLSGHPSGVVSLYVCQGNAGCTMATVGGTFLAAVPVASLAGSGNGQKSAASYTYAPMTSGSYCLAAYYSGDTRYAPSAVTTGQCFVVP